MDFSFYFNDNQLNEQKLKKCGFNLTKGKFLLKKPLNDDFTVEIEIDSQNFNINLIDNNFNEQYEMLNILSINTAFVASLRKQVENLAAEIVKNCLDNINIKSAVVNHIKERYNVIPQAPWDEYPHYLTFKHPKSDKWFALIMDVNMDKLVKNKNYVVDIINLKAPPTFVEKIIDNKNIFPAYHMNKIHWYTVVLNKGIKLEKLMELIDISYNSVKK